MAKEINHNLVSTRWRISQNCRVFRSTELFATDHRLVAKLRIRIRSKAFSRCNPPQFHPEKLKDLACRPTQEYAEAVSSRFEVLGTLEDPGELWDTFIAPLV